MKIKKNLFNQSLSFMKNLSIVFKLVQSAYEILKDFQIYTIGLKNNLKYKWNKKIN